MRAIKHHYAKKQCSELIDKYLSEKILGEDDTVTETVKFDDGFEMDIKCCGSQDGVAWTEAVLFDKNGRIATMTDPSDEFFGEWVLEFDSDVYHVVVERS